jgi:transcription elongation factor Elf1
MYKYELTSLLEKVLGNSYQMKNGENAFHCPFCNHHKKKLQVNFDTQKWHCWVCNKGGHKISILLRKINASREIIKEALKLLNEYVSYSKDKKEVTEYQVSLPQFYKPLWKKSNDPLYKNALSYLNKRGIGAKEILRYSIGYCDGGDYRNRIIIPSYDADGKLNYFMARDMFPNSKLKYKNPPMSIRRNVIPLLGKFPSKTLVKRLIEKKVKTIYVALDQDAQQDAVKLTKFLMDYGIKAYLLELGQKDPSELGFNKFWELTCDVKQSKFSDIIKGRLNG